MKRRTKTTDTIENILRLRRVEREVQPHLRPEIATVRAFLEKAVGPTVRPADAARLLGISHPALLRWVEKAEIATVTTPEGRREVPLGELLSLLDDVERARHEPTARPVARVVNERRRRSEEAVDLNRLLPQRKRRGHRTAELQALAYHRLVAERLDEQLVEQARQRLQRWRTERRVDPRWVDEWERVLAMPLGRVKRALGADTTKARELRQTSPFAGVLSEQERRRLAKAVEDRALA